MLTLKYTCIYLYLRYISWECEVWVCFISSHGNPSSPRHDIIISVTRAGQRTSWGSNMLAGSLGRSVGYCRGTYDDATEAFANSLTDRRGNANHAQIRVCARCSVSAGSSTSPDGDVGHKMRDFCSKQMAATRLPCGPALHDPVSCLPKLTRFFLLGGVYLNVSLE